jgi:hypothetical protein
MGGFFLHRTGLSVLHQGTGVQEAADLHLIVYDQRAVSFETSQLPLLRQLRFPQRFET